MRSGSRTCSVLRLPPNPEPRTLNPLFDLKPDTSHFAIGLNALIVAVTDEVPRILVVERAETAEAVALPYGPLDPVAHRTLELGLRAWVRQRSGLELGYVEQLYTFGDRFRGPREHAGHSRTISIAYLALVREHTLDRGDDATWRHVYDFLPWEDWRDGTPADIQRPVANELDAWVRDAEDTALQDARRERVDIAFARRETPWDEERVLERYELLYEAGLVQEAARDRSPGVRSTRLASPAGLGIPMTLDHRRILASAIGRLRGKLKYRPVVFELLPETFTLLQVQRVVEALAGVRLHKQNFRRLVERGGLVEPTGELDRVTGGRPAGLFRFRREVLRERPTPGVQLPGGKRL